MAPLAGFLQFNCPFSGIIRLLGDLFLKIQYVFCAVLALLNHVHYVTQKACTCCFSLACFCLVVWLFSVSHPTTFSLRLPFNIFISVYPLLDFI